MTKWKIFVILPQILVLVLVFPFQIHAYQAFESIKVNQKLAIASVEDIRLNEIMPNPEGSDTDYEWIEIYNNGEEVIDLNQCTIDSREFPLDMSIEGESYLVVAKDLLDKDADGYSYEARWGDGSGVWGDSDLEDYLAVELSISMKNSNDSVSLICDEYEDVFDWEIAESGQSFSLNDDSEWVNDYDITPGRENEAIPEVIYSQKILITEVYPSPNSTEDDNEWIELYNYDSSDIDLLAWSLEDNTKTKVFNESYIINANSYYVLESTDLGLTLNNSGEVLTLFDPNDEDVDEFEYGTTSKGISNIRKYNDGDYGFEVFQSRAVTKGSRNIYVDIDDLFYGVEVQEIADIKTVDLGEEVCVKGVITVEIGKLGSKLFYIQDAHSGIQIYFYKENFWKNFQLGDELKVLGEIKEINNERRLYVNDENAVKKVSSGNSIHSQEKKTGNIGEKVEGSLVVLTGKIIETSGSNFYIDDGSGSMKILVKSSTNIEVPKKKKGQFAGIIGIVSQYGDAEDSYRILPRYSSDIVISDSSLTYGQVLAVTGNEVITVMILGFGFLILTTIIFKRLKSKKYERSKFNYFRKSTD